MENEKNTSAVASDTTEVRFEPDKLYRRIIHMERWLQDVLEHQVALLRDNPYDFEEAVAIHRTSSRLQLIRDIKKTFKGDYSGLDTIYSQKEEYPDLFV